MVENNTASDIWHFARRHSHLFLGEHGRNAIKKQKLSPVFHGLSSIISPFLPTF